MGQTRTEGAGSAHTQLFTRLFLRRTEVTTFCYVILLC